MGEVFGVEGDGWGGGVYCVCGFWCSNGYVSLFLRIFCGGL